MNCKQAQRSLYGATNLSAEVERHCETCPACRAERDRLAQIRNVVAGQSRVSEAPNVGTVRAAINRFHAEQAEARSTRRRLVNGGLWRAALVPAFGLAAFAGYWAIHPTATPGPTVSQVASVPTPHVQPVPKHADVQRAVPAVQPSAVANVEQERLPHPAPKRSYLPRPTRFVPPVQAPRFVSTTRVPVRTIPVASTASHTANHAVSDDLAFVNGSPDTFAARWASLPPDDFARLEARIRASVRGGDDFVEVPFPRIAATGRGETRAVREAIARFKQEATIVDARLQHRVTLGLKRVSLSDLCEKLTTETGVTFTAAKGVADDKITVFCTDRPARDIMRQVSDLFNFTWERIGDEGTYHYRLKQALRAQLLEEELRNKDRNEALLALDHAMEKYQKYLDLSPEQAKAALEGATGDDKKMLEALAGSGWGPARLYGSLSPEQMNALRAGQEVKFRSNPGEGESPLPDNLRTGILSGLDQTFNTRVVVADDGRPTLSHDENGVKAQGMAVSAYPDAKAGASLRLDVSELGVLRLEGNGGININWTNGKDDVGYGSYFGRPIASGVSPSVRSPENAKVNEALKSDAAMQKPATLMLAAPSVKPDEKAVPLTTADVLEAFHKATGRDVMGDYYTRQVSPDVLPKTKLPVFDLLCQTCDALHLRWNTGDGWLTFRTAGFFNERPKEIPNRLLDRWTALRVKNGSLTLADLAGVVAELSDTQLDATSAAEAIKTLYGLQEWDSVRADNLRGTWRMLASVSPGTLRQVIANGKLTYSEIPLTAQQQWARITLGERPDPNVTAADLEDSTLLLSIVPAESGKTGKVTKPAEARFEFHYGKLGKSGAIRRLTLMPGSTGRDDTKP